MFKIFTVRKRLKKIYEVVKFKSANKQSKLYGVFKVNEYDDGEFITYEFLTYKIIEEKKTKNLSFYSSNMEQMTISKFWISLKNDLNLIESILDKVDKNIFYYSE